MDSKLSVVRIGPNRVLLAHHEFRPHEREIGLPELDRLSEHDILAGWTIASLETFAQQANWAREIFDDVWAVCHNRQWLM